MIVSKISKNMDISLLKKIGFSDKTAKVYLSLLQLGPTSIRKLGENAGLNRGTTYDALNWLKEKGIVSYYKKATKQFFVAEDPERLHELVKEEEDALRKADEKLDGLIPELQALHSKGGDRPVARYYERKEIKEIMEEILDICEHADDSLYRVYSTEGIREYLYDDFPTFSDARVAKGIRVKVIAIGGGGELRGLDERKWLSFDAPIATYTMVYPGHVAHISLDAKKEPFGVVIENAGVYETQKGIFDALWQRL